MSAVQPESERLSPGTSTWPQLLVPEMWASLAIFAMWGAVAISAVWGPDFVSTSGSGATTTTIPSGIAVALFASISRWLVAKHGFRRGGGER